MTYYSYECATHGVFQLAYDMGHAPLEAACPWGDISPRYFGDVRLQFTYGKQDFHGPTIGERLEADRKEWDDAGIKAEPVGTRWV